LESKWDKSLHAQIGVQLAKTSAVEYAKSVAGNKPAKTVAGEELPAPRSRFKGRGKGGAASSTTK
jgi:hypothetical protein